MSYVYADLAALYLGTSDIPLDPRLPSLRFFMYQGIGLVLEQVFTGVTGKPVRGWYGRAWLLLSLVIPGADVSRAWCVLKAVEVQKPYSVSTDRASSLAPTLFQAWPRSAESPANTRHLGMVAMVLAHDIIRAQDSRISRRSPQAFACRIRTWRHRTSFVMSHWYKQRNCTSLLAARTS